MSARRARRAGRQKSRGIGLQNFSKEIYQHTIRLIGEHSLERSQ
jgi:hypothetical protein